MRQIKALALLLAVLLPSLAAAQTQLPTLPPNTVLGRLGVNAGPAQAIPFSTLGPTLITSNLAVTAPLSISGLNLSITGAAGQILAGTPAAFTLTPTLGVSSTSTGSLAFATSGGSGKVTVQAPTTSTNWTFKFPTTAGSNGQALTTDGSGNTSWAAGAGTVNSGTAGQLTYYATTAAAVSGNANATISGAALTLGVAGSSAGTLKLSGATSGTTTLAGQTSGGGTMTFPAGSDTVMSLAATQTATNKTFTSPVLNSPTMTTPTLGVASATSINKVAITAPASGSTLTIADGKTLTDTSGVGASVLLGATGGGFSAYAGASCTNQFVRSLSAAAAATCASVANTDLSNSSVTIGSTNVALGATASTVAGLTLTSPTINGGTAQALTNLGIRSSGGGAFDLVLNNTETLSAQRALTLTVNNAARTVNLSGNLTLGADFTLSGANATALTTTGSTNVTLPTSGTLATINTAQTFSSSNIFSATQQFSDAKFSSGKIYPTTDGTTALQVTKADGTTRIVNFDTTNARVGINKTAGAFDLDVNGAVNVGSTLTFATLDPTSLGTSTSTVTGLTVNNSPSGSNDYVPYYSAADGRIRKITVAALASGAVAGVANLNGLTGGLSIVAGAGMSVSAGGTNVTLSSTNPAIHSPGGRLTLTSNTPVMTSSVTAAGTLYYASYSSNGVPYYNGTTDITDTIPANQVSTAMQAASTGVLNASGVFDVWWDGVNHNICVATNGSGGGWASDTGGGSNTARGTGYSQLDRTTRPYITNANALANCYNGSTNYGSISANRATYLGTIGTTAAGKVDYIFGGLAAGGTAAVFNVWNLNRVTVSTMVRDNTDSWTYAVAATWRAPNGSATMRATMVRGLDEDAVQATYSGLALSGASAIPAAGIGVDSTTAFSGMTGPVFSSTFAMAATGQYAGLVGVGSHFISAIEWNTTATSSTWLGDFGTAYTQTGLSVTTRQ